MTNIKGRKKVYKDQCVGTGQLMGIIDRIMHITPSCQIRISLTRKKRSRGQERSKGTKKKKKKVKPQ